MGGKTTRGRVPASLSRIRKELREKADPRKAADQQRFFKTGPGSTGKETASSGWGCPR